MALARLLKDQPPARSVMLLATSGPRPGAVRDNARLHGRALKGTRLKELERSESRRNEAGQGSLEALAGGDLNAALTAAWPGGARAIDEEVKNEVDLLSASA
jgi:hypothetical protein